MRIIYRTQKTNFSFNWSIWLICSRLWVADRSRWTHVLSKAVHPAMLVCFISIIIIIIVQPPCDPSMCTALAHFSSLTFLIISVTFVLSLTQMLVFLSLFSTFLSILVCAAASLLWHRFGPWFCTISHSWQSTHELNICLFKQMAKLLLKMSRCFVYAAQPAVIRLWISFFFVLFI